MTWYDELDKWTADYLPDMPYEREVPLSRYTSFRIGGPARRMAFPQNGEQLILLLSRARELSARPIILGNGTNLLFHLLYQFGADALVGGAFVQCLLAFFRSLLFQQGFQFLAGEFT